LKLYPSKLLNSLLSSPKSFNGESFKRRNSKKQEGRGRTPQKKLGADIFGKKLEPTMINNDNSTNKQQEELSQKKLDDNKEVIYGDPRVDFVFKVLFCLSEHLWIHQFFVNCVLALDKLNYGPNAVINLPIKKIRNLPTEQWPNHPLINPTKLQ
jgi:hypothetical protein